MKLQTLNLLNPQKGDISVRTLTFNDGEPHIWLDGIDRKAYIHVLCRVANPNDLFILMQVGDILNRQGVEWELHIAYLMGMRMDRVMSFGEAFSLKVVADAINSLQADCVRVCEPHSNRTTELIKHCAESSLIRVPDLKPYITIFPDGGAKVRYNTCTYRNGSDLCCQKRRDPNTGQIVSLEIEEKAECVVERHPGKPFLVLDDLCDGGGTFVRVADILAERWPERERHIFVTHMVNAKGIEALAQHYHRVTFTNSFRDWHDEKLPPNVTVKVIEWHETA